MRIVISVFLAICPGRPLVIRMSICYDDRKQQGGQELIWIENGVEGGGRVNRIKVFLAEDEAVIRHGIRDGVDWNGNGLEFVGEAGDGEYAYPMILKTKPDILLTDVKMPFMDGLELSSLVKKALPDIKIVILSGYNEFDYAQKAVEIGISDYLLKPIASVDLILALKKVAEAIREEREQTKLLERYFVNYEKYTEFLDKTDYSGVDRKLIEDFLKLGSIDECGLFVDEYFAAMGENNYNSLLLRQYMVMDIFYCVQRFLKDLKLAAEEVPPEFREIKKILNVVDQIETTMEYLKNLFTFALSVRDQCSNNRYGDLIREAKAYISEHYDESDFSLRMIAAHIGVSPSYFSSVFKQETGGGVIEYLTKVRIDKACELLRSTTLRTAEIGEKVGYNDPHYFSTTFKKIMGQTPKEYKR